VHPKRGHEGPEGEQWYSSTHSSTSALDGVGGQRHASAALPPGKRSGTHCIGGWMGPWAGLDGCGKSRPHRHLIPRTVQPVASRYIDWAIPARFSPHTFQLNCGTAPSKKSTLPSCIQSLHSPKVRHIQWSKTQLCAADITTDMAACWITRRHVGISTRRNLNAVWCVTFIAVGLCAFGKQSSVKNFQQECSINSKFWKTVNGYETWNSRHDPEPSRSKSEVQEHTNVETTKGPVIT
jgi:hypothetical protein